MSHTLEKTQWRKVKVARPRWQPYITHWKSGERSHWKSHTRWLQTQQETEVAVMCADGASGKVVATAALLDEVQQAIGYCGIVFCIGCGVQLCTIVCFCGVCAISVRFVCGDNTVKPKYDRIGCCVVLCGIALCGIVLCGIVVCSIVLCGIVAQMVCAETTGGNCRSIMWPRRKQGATRPKQGGGLGNNKDLIEENMKYKNMKYRNVKYRNMKQKNMKYKNMKAKQGGELENNKDLAKDKI